MRVEYRISQLVGGAISAPEGSYYEGLLSSGPYVTRVHAELELAAHFNRFPRDNAEYVIIAVYAKSQG